MVTCRVKAINKKGNESSRVEEEFKYENYNEIVDNLMKLKDVLAHVSLSNIHLILPLQVIKHENADVRKSAVFCLVEVHNIVGDELFT